MSQVLHQDVPDEAALVRKIHRSDNNDVVVQTTLQTNEQVIARVTDGIYRQPASALRELISNAYDADATRVVIKTDAPRFGQISVTDNGNGISPETLAYLLYNIGGSAKRNERGEALHITDAKDPSKSPKGRKLIGKIGIGLFSVSQLTQSFQIISKVKGDTHRTVATVSLRQFSETASKPPAGKRRYESGKVSIWREPVSTSASHGTTVILNGIRRQARDTLQSRDIWDVIEENEKLSEDEQQSIAPPKFHIGRVAAGGEDLKAFKKVLTSLPYTGKDAPDRAFTKLVDCVWAELGQSNPRPRLEDIFDYYLRMVWQLALAIPLPYVEKHLFDEPSTGWTKTFLLSNQPRGAAKDVGAKGSTIRQVQDLKDTNDWKFEVFVDGLQLRRPIKFKNLPMTDHSLKHPLTFIGKCEEKFGEHPAELSGGPLAFEAYLFWSPKIAPTEHQGSMIRIHGASGTLFDPTFMRYQIAELTRLRQITCEIFVNTGLESALNIDREAFNNAHPHAVFITKWLHNALRQLATAQKREASSARVTVRENKSKGHASAVDDIATKVWAEQTGDESSFPPAVEIFDGAQKPRSSEGSYAISRELITGTPTETTKRTARRPSVTEEKLAGIIKVLASFDVLDGLSASKQQKLFAAIYKILNERAE